MDNNQIPTRDPDYILEQVNDDYQLRHRERDTAIFINGAAALLWEMCDGEQSVGEIKQALQQTYPDAADAIATDVDEALGILIAHQALASNRKH